MQRPTEDEVLERFAEFDDGVGEREEGFWVDFLASIEERDILRKEAVHEDCVG